ncbi:hypothetical protein [Gloeobacter morelensis]|uniref:Transposase n=1 Tax=Gloeobacter morelensis MG652769 TaxID=2781736 RepID=A0ABY3PKT5_9CYAN|nr:hypothetical protein [Gloeobacter morelensis]UFP94275.1 hypothetical protein ISF26_21385 [Gloeobacter morelensis MG652769]
MALAAIQGLYAVVQEKESEIDRLKKLIAAIEAQYSTLERLVQAGIAPMHLGSAKTGVGTR